MKSNLHFQCFQLVLPLLLGMVLVVIPSHADTTSARVKVNVESEGAASINGVSKGSTKLKYDVEYSVTLDPVEGSTAVLRLNTCGADILVQPLYYQSDQPGQTAAEVGEWRNEGKSTILRKYEPEPVVGDPDPNPDPNPDDPAENYTIKYKVRLQRADIVDEESAESINNGGGMETVYAPSAPRPVTEGGGCCASPSISAGAQVVYYSSSAEMSAAMPSLVEMAPVAYYEFPLGAVLAPGGQDVSPREKRYMSFGTLMLTVDMSAQNTGLTGIFDYRPGPKEVTPAVYHNTLPMVYLWNPLTVTRLHRISDTVIEVAQFKTAEFADDPATDVPRKTWLIEKQGANVEFRHYDGPGTGEPTRVDRFSAIATQSPLSLETTWDIDGKSIERQFKESLSYSVPSSGGIARRVTTRSEVFKKTASGPELPVSFQESVHEFYYIASDNCYSYLATQTEGLGMARRKHDYSYQLLSGGDRDVFIKETILAPDGTGELVVPAASRAWHQNGFSEVEPWLSAEPTAQDTLKIRVTNDSFGERRSLLPPGIVPSQKSSWMYNGSTTLSRSTKSNQLEMLTMGTGFYWFGHDPVHGTLINGSRVEETQLDVLGRLSDRKQMTDYHMVEGGSDGTMFVKINSSLTIQESAPRQTRRGPVFRQIDGGGLAREHSLEKVFLPPTGSDLLYPASQAPFTIRHDLHDLKYDFSLSNSLWLSTKMQGQSTRVSTVSGKYGALSEETFVWSGTAWESMSMRRYEYWEAGHKRGKLRHVILDDDIIESHDYSPEGVRTTTDADGVVSAYTNFDDDALAVEVRVAADALNDWEAQPAVTVTRSRLPALDIGNNEIVTGYYESETTSAGDFTQEEIRTYDLGGELLSSTDATGMVTTYKSGYLNNDATQSESSAGTAITRSAVHYMDGRLKAQGGSAQTKRTLDYEVRADTGPVDGITIPAGILETETLWDGDAAVQVNRRVTTGDGELIWEHVNGVTTSYGYDNAGRLVSRTTPAPGGGQRVYLYVRDYRGFVIKEGWDVDGDGQLLAASEDVLTEHGQAYEKGPDNSWWLVTVSSRYVLDDNAAVQRATVRKIKQGTGATRISQVIHEDGAVETTTRTISGKVATQTTTSTRHPGAVQMEVYYNGRLVSSQAFGQPQPVLYRYDALGRLTEVEDPSSLATQTTVYDAPGRLLTVESNAGTTSHGYYPANAETPNAGRLHWVEQPGGARVYYAYNARGQITSQWGTGAQPLRWIYDGLGQVKHLDTFLTREPAIWGGPDMPALMASQELTANVSRRTFDVSQGRLAGRTFGMGEDPTEYYYHPDGSLQSKDTGYWDGPAVYGYDAAGRLSEIDYSPGQTPSITLVHDRSGRVQTRTDSAGMHSFDYPPDGTVVETVSGGLWDGLVLTRRVDGAGRLAEVEWSFAGVQRLVKYDYDSHSRLNQASFGLVNQPPQVSASYHWLSGTRRVERLERPIAGSVQPLNGVFTHDGAGRLEKLEWQRGATLYGSHEYSFDAAGRRQTETRQDGTTLHYAYTARGELEQVERRRSDNSLRPDWTHGYSYDDSGNRATTDTPEGEHLIHEMPAPDLAGVSWRVLTSGAAPDRGGALKHWLRGRAHSQALVEVNGQAAQREGQHWRYLHSKTWASPDTVTITASRPDLGTEAPPPVSREHRLPGSGLSPEFDLQGNLKLLDGPEYGWECDWDAENRLVTLTHYEPDPEGTGFLAYILHQIGYTYDAQGRRISKRVSALRLSTGEVLNFEETLFLWDGWTLLAEFVRTQENGPLHLRRGYLWGLDLSGSLEGAGGVGGLLWVVEHTPGRAESHRQLAPWYDGNGNVMGWVENEPGYTLPLWRLEYDPYGKLLVEDPVRVARHQKYRTLGIEEKWLHRPPVGFSTKYEVAETGLLYYGYRYYSPELGRWLSRDPIGEQGGVNLYGMAGNDLVNKFDILGLITDVDIEVVNHSRPHRPMFVLWPRRAPPLTIASVRWGLHDSLEVQNFVRRAAKALCDCKVYHEISRETVPVQTEHAWSLNQSNADLSGRYTMKDKRGSFLEWDFRGEVEPQVDEFDFSPLFNNRGLDGEIVNAGGAIAAHYGLLATFQINGDGPVPIRMNGVIDCNK